MTAVRLLPSNATALEVALDDVLARPDQIPAPLRQLWRPDEIDPALLPWLAWALSVDYWREDWSEAKRRSVAGYSIHHHQTKGTLASVRYLANVAGGSLRKAYLPPSRAMLGPTWTDEAREQWLSRYPELRVYRQRVRGRRAGMMPVNSMFSFQESLWVLETGTWNDAGVWKDDIPWSGYDPAPPVVTRYSGTAAKSFLGTGTVHGTAFPVTTTALKRTFPRVYEVRDNVETELTTAVFERGTRTVETVRIEATPARRGRVTTEVGGETVYQIVGRALRGAGAMFGDASVADAPVGSRLWLSVGRKRYLADKRAHKRTFLTRFTDLIEMPDADPMLARATVQPLVDRQRSGIDVMLTEGDVMTARAEPVAEQSVRQGAFYGRLYPGTLPGASRPSSHLVDHYPGARMYLRSRLYDPAVPAPSQSGMFFCGATRLGMPPYHAELKVALRRKRPRQAFSGHVAGCFVASKPPFDPDLMAAFRSSTPARDKITLNTKTVAPIRAGGEILASPDIVAGQWRDTL